MNIKSELIDGVLVMLYEGYEYVDGKIYSDIKNNMDKIISYISNAKLEYSGSEKLRVFYNMKDSECVKIIGGKITEEISKGFKKGYVAEVDINEHSYLNAFTGRSGAYFIGKGEEDAS